jgi:hypothetical protein
MAKKTEQNNLGVWLLFIGGIVAGIITLATAIYNGTNQSAIEATKAAVQREIERDKLVLPLTLEAQRTLFAVQNIPLPANTMTPLIRASPTVFTSTSPAIFTPTPLPTTTPTRLTPSPARTGLPPLPTPTLIGGGGRIVFSYAQGAYLQIQTINPDGSNQQALLDNHNFSDGSPKWSPDGCSIVFDSILPNSPDARFTIQIVDLDGRNLRTLIKDSTANFGKSTAYYQQPAWSPYGNFIAFAVTG